ncbi:putative adenosine monophosphate-protein transferase Fic [Shimwellia pseudoproteus]|uniref:putative adenosine monophosphate-protein transferase Fic n=1 Tax=Shimwellia pseudoproteus TaxID=570012 RepID=UPI0018EB0468|nr:putative adenosine monophosphate-protein transferase Fic [Shimwellia pseudoproteus]MBJ3815028.1 putative adenosine monophosphate-protein transferase Fic [Shimwellia pseudoproteus]
MNDTFGDVRDPYFWSGSEVFRNRLNIREAARLQEAEIAFTSLRAATLELGPPRPGLPHLCHIHRQLFQDIYEWAGKIRQVDIYRGDTRFCHFDYLEKEGNAVMRALEDENYLLGLPLEVFTQRLAHFYCEVNVLHPFRTGNGRAQRIFFEQLAIHAGYSLDWRGLAVVPWRQANQQGAMGDLQPLEAIFSKVVSEAAETE